MHPQPLHLKGLNGLRAIAALAVVFSHITLSLHSFGLNPFLFGANQDGTPKGLDMAGFGVSIFFSLSGFLITYLLLLEREKKEINIPHFYIRRILRIWPLYYLYLILSLIANVLYGHDIPPNSVYFYIFFSANIPFVVGGALPLLYHFWSLGVEEQFYLFWPWIIKKSTQKLFVLTLTLTLVLIGLKLLFKFFAPEGTSSLLYSFLHVTRFHCMLIGAMGAILYFKHNTFFIRVCTSKIAQLVSWSIMALILANHFHVASVLDNELVSIVTLIIIIGQITERNRLINLESRLFDFLGKISYGLYVIHPLVILSFTKAFNSLEVNHYIKYALVFGGITCLTILISHLSYEYFEKWFLQLKNKYTAIHTSLNKTSARTLSKSAYVEKENVPVYI